jgi:hypothetical protein
MSLEEFYCRIGWGHLSEAEHSISFLGPIPRHGVQETKAFGSIIL